MERLVKALAERIEKEMEVKVVVSIECAEIHLQNLHNLDIIGIAETENTLQFETTLGMNFTVGKDAEVAFNEFENEYTLTYHNDTIIIITII